tara:strand:- start:892 stop:1284 length:393 start_codon:yes stop_codon:yes gene_type:complete
MRLKIVIILFLLYFIPKNSFADWIMLFSINEGDLYIDSSSIKRKKNRIFYNQLVNYKKKKSNGILSLISYSELDCKSLKIRDLNYELFELEMGRGKNIYKGRPSKKWKKYADGTSANLVNKLLCERVHSP